jgi:RNA-directed DNA polymerase
VLEDKIVQRSTVEVLNAIYEVDFVGFSYGFRPGRSPHQALDALAYGIWKKWVNWILDSDLQSFFDTVRHDWLVQFLEYRVADRRVIRLIQKWLNAGVLEDGTRMFSEIGTVQGGSISPLLANVYLHYAFDLWAQQWRMKQTHGALGPTRYRCAPLSRCALWRLTCGKSRICGKSVRSDPCGGCGVIRIPTATGTLTATGCRDRPSG